MTPTTPPNRDNNLDGLPAGILEAVAIQREEYRRRMAIVRAYEKLVRLRPHWKHRTDRGPFLDRLARKKLGVSQRSCQAWAKRFRELRPSVRRLLSSAGPIRLRDLPVRIEPTARRRFDLIQAYRTALRHAHLRGLGIGRITRSFLRHRPGLTLSTLYRWHARYRAGDQWALADLRRLWLLKRGSSRRNAADAVIRPASEGSRRNRIGRRRAQA